MSFLETSLEKLEYMCANLEEGYNELFFVIQLHSGDNGYYMIDRIKDMFYNQMCDCHPEIISIRVDGALYQNAISIHYEITL